MISIREPLTYHQFLKHLGTLLSGSGILHRLPVVAGLKEKTGKPGENPGEYEEDLRIGRVISYIEDHLADTISLDQLAEEAHLSKYHFIRQFRGETGITPWQYLLYERLQKAKELLKEGHSPAEAAAEAGFYDQSHLTRAFNRETGMTPKEYQESGEETDSKDRNNIQDKDMVDS